MKTAPSGSDHSPSRIYAIGDIHGRYDLLIKALAYIERRHTTGEEHTVVVLGDYIDRGPSSRSVIERLMEGAKIPGQKMVCLMGNHERMLTWALEGDKMIFKHGGVQTLASYGCMDPNDTNVRTYMPADHIDWIKSLPLTYETKRHLFVHARVSNQWPVDECSEDLKLWGMYSTGEPGFTNEAKVVVHGHVTVNFPTVDFGRVNLDVGSHRSGKLAVGVFNDEYAYPIELAIVHADKPTEEFVIEKMEEIK